MKTKWNLAGMKIMYRKRIYIYKGELTQVIRVISMAIWGCVPVKNFVVPVLHL